MKNKNLRLILSIVWGAFKNKNLIFLLSIASCYFVMIYANEKKYNSETNKAGAAGLMIKDMPKNVVAYINK